MCTNCNGPRICRGRYCNDCAPSCTDHSSYDRTCKACQGARRKVTRKEWLAENQERALCNQRRRRYGITHEHALLVAKAKRCEICDDEVDLVLDHDHVTGDYRGMICNPCNKVLGFARDSPLRLRLAAAYLER